VLTNPPPNSASSFLHDEATFYKQLTRDLLDAKEEVVIESPFISAKRMRELRPYFEKLINKGVKVFIITRDPDPVRRRNTPF